MVWILWTVMLSIWIGRGLSCTTIPNQLFDLPNSLKPSLFVKSEVEVDDGNYTMKKIVNREDIQVEYAIIDSKYLYIRAELNSFGWLAIGLNRYPVMAGTEAVVFNPPYPPTLNFIGNKKSPFQIFRVANNYLQNVSYETIEGNYTGFCYKTRISFMRPFKSPLSEAIELNLKDRFVLNWAFGPQLFSQVITYHPNRDSVYFTLENNAFHISSESKYVQFLCVSLILSIILLFC